MTKSVLKRLTSFSAFNMGAYIGQPIKFSTADTFLDLF